MREYLPLGGASLCSSSALARNYHGLLAKSDPPEEDRNTRFALRQMPRQGLRRSATPIRLRRMRDLHAFGVDDDADTRLHCAKSCS